MNNSEMPSPELNVTESEAAVATGTGRRHAQVALAVAAGLCASRGGERQWRALPKDNIHATATALPIGLVGFLAVGLSGGELLAWIPYPMLASISAARLIPTLSGEGETT